MTPPMGFGFLSAKAVQAIVVLVYLANTSRSQGFSPSQRLTRLSLVVLFHTTSAHRICGLQSFSLSASRCTSRYSLLSCCQTGVGTSRKTCRAATCSLPLHSMGSLTRSSSSFPLCHHTVSDQRSSRFATDELRARSTEDRCTSSARC